jgi:transcriptional regulator with XRE-family HTH domain
MLRVRQERGLSQEQLAEAARVHENTVRLLEQGKRMPSVLLLVQVAAGLACSPTELLDGVLREVGPIPLSDADGEPDHP